MASEQVILVAHRALGLQEKPPESWDGIRGSLSCGWWELSSSTRSDRTSQWLLAPSPFAKASALFGHDSPTDGSGEIPVQELCSSLQF